ncbi:MAG: maleylpyruvate isomerase N-terminal domain-containing protein [Actinomycetota bacterium]|nr:maleylpyruvate isomerase N-terminal domain-containing protein [Actinomycetota bacterium]
MNEVRRALLDAYRGIEPLLTSDELKERWNEESALADFPVGALAGHLVRAGAAVVSYLAAGMPEEEPVAAPVYYSTVLAAMDASDHNEVVSRGQDVAGASADDLLATFRRTVDELEQALTREPAERVVKVYRGIVLRLDDYLLSRLCEVLIHTDDLAVSLDLEPPAIPAAAGDLAITHLVDVARTWHGDRGVLIALSRKERDHADALNVFKPVPRG